MNTSTFFRGYAVMVFASLSLLAVSVLPAHAHFPWINLEDGQIDVDRNLKWTVGWGHRFPISGMMKAENIEAMTVIGPDGSGQTKAIAASELEFQSESTLTKPGAYVVAMSRKPSFYTRTKGGSKRQSKAGLTDVISCSHGNSFMKAVANVGSAGSGGKVDAVAGHAMEIVPLANPASLKVGDFLPFKVLFKGKPHSGEFFATYSGFSTENGVWAYAATTDKEGMGKLKILHSGAWLLKVDTEEAYADPKECDKESYLADLTFEVP
jgi:uncharacterized GH25 family protein